MKVALDLLSNFIKSNKRNEWLYGDTISVYVRKSYRFIIDNDSAMFQECLDIANISVDEEVQNTGIFTSFLTEVTEKYSDKNIYIESILNPAVEHICKKLGFVYVNCNEEIDYKNMIKLAA